jgi:hypothetical protein
MRAISMGGKMLRIRRVVLVKLGEEGWMTGHLLGNWTLKKEL